MDVIEHQTVVARDGSVVLKQWLFWRFRNRTSDWVVIDWVIDDGQQCRPRDGGHELIVRFPRYHFVVLAPEFRRTAGRFDRERQNRSVLPREDRPGLGGFPLYGDLYPDDKVD